MSDTKEVNKDKRNIAYVLTFIALLIGFFLAKKYYAIILLWGIIPFPVTLGDRYIFLLDDPIPRIKSLVLGLLSLCVTVYFIRRIYKETDAGKKLKFGVISLITSILFSLAFYVITPSYTFQNYPQLFMYMDSKGAYIQNPDYYFWLVDHLGFYQETYRPFKTLDDAIKGLEFAKNQDDGLYSYVFADLQKFGYDKVIEKYKDSGFQKEILLKFVSVDYKDGIYEWEKESVKEFLANEKFINTLERNTEDAKIKNACLYVEKRYSQYEKRQLTEKELYHKLYMEVKDLLN